MEKSLFSETSVSQLEFTTPQTKLPAPPSELPRPPATAQWPKEILKSAIVENLLSQNEDLMARLKVSLRRLNFVENENAVVRAENDQLRASQISTQESREIWLEKEQNWKAKGNTLEEQNLILKEKTRVLEANVQRLEKYHNQVRTHIKPRLVELKEYANQMEAKVESMTDESHRREALISDLRNQIVEVSKNARYQVEQNELRVHELIDSYEKSLKQTQKTLETLKERNEHLEPLVARTQRAEARADQFENELIEFKRHREERERTFETSTRAWHEKVQTYTNENTRLNLENEDLKAKVMGDYEQIQKLEQTRLDQQQQLESLRFLHNNKLEECERLKMALATLERLNVELSTRLNQTTRES